MSKRETHFASDGLTGFALDGVTEEARTWAEQAA